MNHQDILLKTVYTLKERIEVYGDPAVTFERAATIASTILNNRFTAYDIAIIMHAVKLSRIPTSPQHLDNYEDGINYLAFAAEFVGAGGASHAVPKKAPPTNPFSVEPTTRVGLRTVQDEE